MSGRGSPLHVHVDDETPVHVHVEKPRNLISTRRSLEVGISVVCFFYNRSSVANYLTI